MARFTFQPAATRASASFALANGQRIRSGMVFEVTEEDLPIIKLVNERVPGPAVTGSKDRLLAIRPVEAQPGPAAPLPSPANPAIEGDLYAQLAQRVGLAPTVSPVGLLEEVGIRLSRLEEIEAQAEKKKRKPQAEKPAEGAAPGGEG